MARVCEERAGERISAPRYNRMFVTPRASSASSGTQSNLLSLIGKNLIRALERIAGRSFQ
jgi:hypothetical protein